MLREERRGFGPVRQAGGEIAICSAASSAQSPPEEVEGRFEK